MICSHRVMPYQIVIMMPSLYVLFAFIAIPPLEMCVKVICFFIKQKTAYEVRISDWSPDVCSSDLNPRRKIGRIIADGPIAHGTDPAAALQRARDLLQQIGSAACRESVCQYV